MSRVELSTTIRLNLKNTASVNGKVNYYYNLSFIETYRIFSNMPFFVV